MRPPIAAGTLYPSDKNDINKITSNLSVQNSIKFNSLLSLFVPNSKIQDFTEGYINAYSTLINIPETTTFVLLSGNKTKKGGPVSISNEDWFTPLGRVYYDSALGESIKKHSNFAEFDNTAHSLEDSIEVQLPFIQSIVKKPKFVAISLSISNNSIVEDMVNALETSASILNKDILVIGSSKLFHCPNYDMTEKKKNKIIDILDRWDEESIKELEKFMNLILQDESSVDPVVFLIPFLYSVRNGFYPQVLAKKVIKSRIKEEADSYLSIAYVK